MSIAGKSTFWNLISGSASVPLCDLFTLLLEGRYSAYGTQSPDWITVNFSDDLLSWEIPPSANEGLALNKADVRAVRLFWVPEMYL